jgi:hypothetical protein
MARSVNLPSSVLSHVHGPLSHEDFAMSRPRRTRESYRFEKDVNQRCNTGQGIQSNARKFHELCEASRAVSGAGRLRWFRYRYNLFAEMPALPRNVAENDWH